MKRSKTIFFPVRVLLTAALILLGIGILKASGADGEPLSFDSDPHKPLLTIRTIMQLRQHYQAVRPYLPKSPFILEDQWVIPKPENPHTFPDDPDQDEIFSPNGDYVAVVGERNIASHLRSVSLMTVKGNTIWSKQIMLSEIWVTKDGKTLTINHDHPNSSWTLTIYSRDGEILKELQDSLVESQVSDALHIKLIPDQDLFLVWTDHQLLAVNNEGQMLWNYKIPQEKLTSIIQEPGLDPLGRGIYVPIQNRNDSTVALLNAQTGSLIGNIWQDEHWPIPTAFSPTGKYAALVAEKQIGLVNWQTGKIVFINKTRRSVIDLLSGKEVQVAAVESASTSEEPLRLAVSLSNDLGVSVFDENGYRIWWNRIAPIESVRTTLSSDSQALGVAIIDSNPKNQLTLRGFALFNIENRNKGGVQQ